MNISRARLIILLIAFCSASCVTIVYRDGYIFVTGVPTEIKSIQIILSVREGTYREIISAAIDEEGNSEPICLGAMYRRTYRKGEITINGRDADGNILKRLKNKDNVTVDGTESNQPIPYDAFE